MGWFRKSAPKKPCPRGLHQMEATWLNCPLCPSTPQPKKVDATPTMEIFKGPPVVGWLVALDGRHKGEDFKIKEGRNRIGRNANCQVVITDDAIGGEHAQITYKKEENHFEIVDLGSTNGTFVYQDGAYKKVSSRELLDNDTIRLGQTELRFKCLG
jgi:hypothetical protein